MLDRGVVVIGSGPAGQAAAGTLADFGERVTVIDEHARPGGPAYRGAERESVQPATGLLAGSQLMLGAEVVGALPGQTLLVSRTDELIRVGYDQLIVCAGCHERAMPFPGWTLPGVMALGGAQLLIKGGLVRPGRRAVLAGTGPLLLVAAEQLALSGVRIQAVVEIARRRDLVRRAPRLLAGGRLLARGATILGRLRALGVPVRRGWMVVEARGDQELREVRIAPVDRHGRMRGAQARRLPVDLLCVGHDFVPRTQILEMLGCAMWRSPAGESQHPVMDAWGRTTQRNVFAAGDGAEVVGGEAAAQAGRIAALGALVDAGTITRETAQSVARPARRRIARLRRFRSAFELSPEHRSNLIALADGPTPVCRCEQVTRAQLDRAIAAGATTLTDLKMATRLGMGACQGKVCAPFCAEYLVARGRATAGDVGALRPRFPLAPLPMSTLIEGVPAP